MASSSIPTALIIGASSGMGLALARLLAGRGFRLGLAARRGTLLDLHARQLPTEVLTQVLDVGSSTAVAEFQSFVRRLGTVDQVYLCAGTGHLNPGLDLDLEDETLRVNALGFAALATSAFTLFQAQGYGHLVGITSIAALMGSAEAPAYNASKACASRYLDGLRQRAKSSRLPIHVTDILPGFVDTAMMKAEKPFWVASPEKAASQILYAVDRRRARAYVTRRWRLVAVLLRLLAW